MKKKKSENNVGTGFALGVAAASAALAGYYLFGPKGKENRVKVKGWMIKAKGEVLEKIETLEHLTEDKYHTIVDSVLAKYEKLKSITEEETKKLKKELKSRYKQVEKDLQQAQKKVTKKTKTARAAVAKKIAPKSKKKK